MKKKTAKELALKHFDKKFKNNRFVYGPQAVEFFISTFMTGYRAAQRRKS